MWKRVLILAACLAFAAVAVARADRYEIPVDRSGLAAFPTELGPWHGVPQTPFTQHVLDVLGVDDYLVRTYYTPDRAGVGLYIGYWGSQRQGDAIHSPQNCLPGAGWEPVAQGMLRIPDPRKSDGSSLTVNRYVVRKGLEQQLVLYWYQSHGRIVASEYWGKVYTVVDAVRLNRTDAAIVRVIAPVDPEAPDGQSRAEQQAVAFVNALLPRLDPFIPQ
jgi:EpsI family protein